MAGQTFGKRVRLLRERARFSLKQLAEKVGTDEYHVAGWERNMEQPDKAMVLLLAAALGVSTDELLTDRPPS